MKTIIHVNQHIIKRNAKGQPVVGLSGYEPPLTVKTYKDNRKGMEAIIYDDDGREVARVVYRPEKPLSCGAKVWIETANEVEVV